MSNNQPNKPRRKSENILDNEDTISPDEKVSFSVADIMKRAREIEMSIEEVPRIISPPKTQSNLMSFDCLLLRLQHEKSAFQNRRQKRSKTLQRELPHSNPPPSAKPGGLSNFQFEQSGHDRHEDSSSESSQTSPKKAPSRSVQSLGLVPLQPPYFSYFDDQCFIENIRSLPMESIREVWFVIKILQDSLNIEQDKRTRKLVLMCLNDITKATKRYHELLVYNYNNRANEMEGTSTGNRSIKRRQRENAISENSESASIFDFEEEMNQREVPRDQRDQSDTGSKTTKPPPQDSEKLTFNITVLPASTRSKSRTWIDRDLYDSIAFGFNFKEATMGKKNYSDEEHEERLSTIPTHCVLLFSKARFVVSKTGLVEYYAELTDPNTTFKMSVMTLLQLCFSKDELGKISILDEWKSVNKKPPTLLDKDKSPSKDMPTLTNLLLLLLEDFSILLSQTYQNSSLKNVKNDAYTLIYEVRDTN